MQQGQTTGRVFPTIIDISPDLQSSGWPGPDLEPSR
jgi:hypothetical protein